MSPPRRLTFAVGTGLLSASLASGVIGCAKKHNHPVNVHPSADSAAEPSDLAAPDEDEDEDGVEGEPRHVNVRAPG